MGFNGTSLWWLSPFPNGWCTISHIFLGWVGAKYCPWLFIILLVYQIFNYYCGAEGGCIWCRLKSINEYMCGAAIVYFTHKDHGHHLTLDTK